MFTYYAIPSNSRDEFKEGDRIPSEVADQLMVLEASSIEEIAEQANEYLYKYFHLFTLETDSALFWDGVERVKDHLDD